jgi:hypothetical protein
MAKVDEYIQRCDVEIKRCRTTRAVEEAREALWEGFKIILEDIKREVP